MRDALLRRSEAAALTWADLERADDGSGRLTIRRAKGDQEGRGAVVYIGTEALAALEAIPPGEAGPDAPVFASPREPGRALSESAIARATAPRRAAGRARRRLRGALAPDRHGPRPQPRRDGHPRHPAGRPLGQPGAGRALHPLRERRPRRRRRLLWATIRCSGERALRSFLRWRLIAGDAPAACASRGAHPPGHHRHSLPAETAYCCRVVNSRALRTSFAPRVAIRARTRGRLIAASSRRPGDRPRSGARPGLTSEERERLRELEAGTRHGGQRSPLSPRNSGCRPARRGRGCGVLGSTLAAFD